jgi:uncharacterized membrane protein
MPFSIILVSVLPISLLLILIACAYSAVTTWHDSLYSNYAVPAVIYNRVKRVTAWGAFSCFERWTQALENGVQDTKEVKKERTGKHA